MRLRILHLLSSWPTLGELSHGPLVHAHARAAIEAGHDARALIVPYQLTGGQPLAELTRVPSPAATTPPLQDIEGVPTWVCTRLDDVGAELLSILDDWRPDVLHYHHTHERALTKLASTARGVPIVLTSHLPHGDAKLVAERPQLAAITRAAMLEADCVIACVEAGRARLAAWLGTPTPVSSAPAPAPMPRIRVAGHGVADSPQLRARAMARTHAPARETVHVCFAGRFALDKGIDELVAAIPPALARAPMLRFVLIGHQRALAQRQPEQILAALGPAAHAVRIEPWLDEPALLRELGDADVLVAPSRFESFGVAIVQAMLAGLPIVATSTEGAGALLDDTRAVLIPLVDGRADIAALAHALAELAHDRPRRLRLGAHAAAHARAALGWGPVVDALTQIYTELADARRHG